MSAIDRFLKNLEIKVPAAATLSQLAPTLQADYCVREFAREAARRISKKYSLPEDDIFWLIVDEPDPEKEEEMLVRREAARRYDDEEDWDYDEEEDEFDED